MAFNNWPYTNFQDLNLGWIIAKIKEVITSSAEALAKAEAVETEVGTYSSRLETAENNASGAYSIANLAREEAGNAQSDATSGIAIGEAAQATANAANTTASAALGVANNAADSADSAVDSAATAERNAAVAMQTATLAVDDYLDVHITAYPSNPIQANKNVDDILSAVTAGKKIRFTLEDSRNGDTYVTYDYQIITVENTANDINIQVYFDTSISNSSIKFFLATFSKTVNSEDVVTYSLTGGDVTFSGSGVSANAVLYTLQTLTNSERAQARSNIGAGHYNIGVSSDQTIMTITNVDTGAVNAYQINKPPYMIPIQYVNGSYVTSATNEDIYNNIKNCYADFNGVMYYPIGCTYSGPSGDLYLACENPVIPGTVERDIFRINFQPSGCTVTKYEKDIKLLPDTTNASADDFLMLDSNKNPAWVAVPNAANVSFGGV